MSIAGLFDHTIGQMKNKHTENVFTEYQLLRTCISHNDANAWIQAIYLITLFSLIYGFQSESTFEGHIFLAYSTFYA